MINVETLLCIFYYEEKVWHNEVERVRYKKLEIFKRKQEKMKVS